RGILSYANKGPNSNKCQFFITYAAHPQLDLKNTVFGHVIDGFETLDLFEKQPVETSSFKPLNILRINDVTIHANPFAVK
ncbi:MAG: Peptidyl-prolyl cis-trans isomerase-like 3, partial [Paramarteilia canceri]